MIFFLRSEILLQKIFSFFKYGEEQIEVVDRYVYLGVPFSGSCSFAPVAKKFTGSENLAVGSILRTIHLSGANSWKSYTKLFDSLALTILMYANQVWALNFLDLIEKTQLSFLKQLLYLPRNTPSYALRVETGTFTSLS